MLSFFTCTLALDVILTVAVVGGMPLGVMVVEDPDANTTATSSPVQETPVEAFKRVDVDVDGGLTFDEYIHMDAPFIQMKREEFEALDTNHDGVVSKSEYDQHYQQDERQQESSSDYRALYFGKIFEEFDENMDLKIDEGELRNILSKRFLLTPKEGVNLTDVFDRFDTDHDGGLDLNEYMQMDREFPFHLMDPIGVTPSHEYLLEGGGGGVEGGEPGEREHAPLVDTLPEEHPILAFKNEKMPLMKKSLSVSEKLMS